MSWPEQRDIDAPLVAGAILFGTGWGLVGLCPGPALVNLAGLSLPIVVFVVAMVIGMLGATSYGSGEALRRARRVRWWRRRRMGEGSSASR